MRRRSVLALAASLLLASAGAASASTSTDTVLTTATASGLTITGGVVPTTSVNLAIGAVGEVPGSIMTVSDLRGAALGWDVTAKYVAPPATALTDQTVKPLGASAVKVKTAASGVSTSTGGTLSYAPSYVQLDATNPVKVAGATATASGGVTAFTTTYQVTMPTNAAVGDLYGASVSYTVAPLPTV